MDLLRARLEDQAYEDAIRYCANSILPMHFGEKLINKIFGRNLQSHAAGLLAVMHCEAELGLGERPTLSQIQTEMGRSRTLHGFFALLRFAGFIETTEHQADKRAKVLIAKPALLDGLKTWLSHHMSCAEVAGLLSAGSAHRLKTDPDFAIRYIAAARCCSTGSGRTSPDMVPGRGSTASTAGIALRWRCCAPTTRHRATLGPAGSHSKRGRLPMGLASLILICATSSTLRRCRATSSRIASLIAWRSHHACSTKSANSTSASGAGWRKPRIRSRTRNVFHLIFTD